MPQRKSKETPQSTIEQINAQYGKLPPQAVEVEEAVLGACMLERDAIYKVTPIINYEAFYKEEHQRIFQVIEEMSSGRSTIDLLQVTRKLKDLNLLDEVGGPVYITQLTRRVASAAHIEHHALIIRQKFLQRQMIVCGIRIQEAAYNEDADESANIYATETQRIDNLMAGNSGMMHIRDILQDTTKAIEERQVAAKNGEVPGIPTGLADLNALNNGWQPGDLVVIAARPSMGKTAIAINLFGKAAAAKGKQVNIFSLEMENIKLSTRLILSYGGIVRENLERGSMNDGDWQAYNNAVAQLEKLPIYIDDSARTTVRYIDAVVRNKVRKGECDIVIIDYLQLVETPEHYSNKNREREVAEISRGLKQVAKDAGVPVILLAQLNRGVENREDKTPRLADLRESGAIEQDADIVIFPWRPCHYDKEAMDENGVSLKNVMLLEIAKYRDGRTGTVWAKHNNDLTQFFDYDTRELPEVTNWYETE